MSQLSTVSDHYPVCLSIAGLDPSGGAGIIADVHTFSAFDCFATAAITSITYQNSAGVFGMINQTAGSLRGQVDPILAEHKVAATKIGMLPTREIVNETARILGLHSLHNVILDPVIRASSGAGLVDDEAAALIIKDLFPLADLITPNIREAEQLSGVSIKGREDVKNAGFRLIELGAKNVLIKGGHSFSGETSAAAIDYLFLCESLTEIPGDFIESASMRGTGCRLSSAIAANLALGKNMLAAVETAKEFVADLIRRSQR